MKHSPLSQYFPLSGLNWEALLQESKFSKSEDYPYLGDVR